MRLRLWTALILLAAPALPQSTISTVLGGPQEGWTAQTATLNKPVAVASDSKGNVYIAVRGAHQVLRVDSAGLVHTFAGSGATGSSGDGGPATAAMLNTPAALAIDSSGAVYIADSGASVIRRVGKDGVISTIAGNGNNAFSGDGGLAINASLSGPAGLCFDNSGSLLIADTGNSVIRKIGSDGIIRTIAGKGRTRGTSGNGGLATAALFMNPQSVAAASDGRIFIADTGNNWIRVIGTDGNLSMYGGYDSAASTSSRFGQGDQTIATNATLTTPVSLAIDHAGTLYFCEPYRVRAIYTTGKIGSFAGTGSFGISGDGGLARYANIDVQGIFIDSHDNIYIADGDNNKVRLITAADGIINTFAGNGTASFNPRGLALNGNYLYFSDTSANRVRRFNLTTGEVSLVAGTGTADYTGDGMDATTATLDAPRGLAFDKSGSLYIADTGNNRIRRVSSSGVIDTVAGNGTATTTGDGGQASVATLHTPVGVAVDASGNVFISEQAGAVIRMVNSSGVISTVAGTGTGGAPSSETGTALSQKLSSPSGLAWDPTGALVIADTGNNRIRRLSSDGTITTVAGSSNTGFAGDGGAATSASLRSPSAVYYDSFGQMYIVDAGNYRIRRVGATDGKISTLAGNGIGGYIGDGTPATAYELNAPAAVVPATASCSVYVADGGNLRIRQLFPAVDYSIAASLAGLQVILDGKAYTAPFTASLLPGTHHRLEAAGPQSLTAGVRYLPAAAQEFDVACGVARVSLSVPFQAQYALTVTSDPGGSVSSASAWQDANASLTLTATPKTGYVFSGWEGDCTGTGSCTLQMNGPKNVKADFAPSTALSPAVSANGIVGAGLSTPPVIALAPNGLAIAFGTGFSPAGSTVIADSTMLLNGALPTELAGVCVYVGSVKAPVLAVTPTQVNFQTPSTLANGPASLQVATACGTANEVRSAAQSVNVQAAAPEFFYFTHNASGSSPIAAVNISTGTYVGAPGLLASPTFAPAKPGEIVTLYGTGFGATLTAISSGQAATAASPLKADVKVTIGSITLASTDVIYAGITPGAAGLYQLNLRIPSSVPDGDQVVQVTIGGGTGGAIGGAVSPSTASIAVKK